MDIAGGFFSNKTTLSTLECGYIVLSAWLKIHIIWGKKNREALGGICGLGGIAGIKINFQN